MIKGDDENTLLWHRMEVSTGTKKKNLQRTSVLSLSGKFNPENIFSQSEHLANKEPKVTCEMGLKSTHLL